MTSSQATTKINSINLEQRIGNNTSLHRPCIFVRQKNGWGNTMLFTLHNVLQRTTLTTKQRTTAEATQQQHWWRSTTQEVPIFPCVRVRGYGEIISQLFVALPQCPVDLDPDKDQHCLDTRQNPLKRPPWHEMKKTIQHYRRRHNHVYTQLLQLNASFVHEIWNHAPGGKTVLSSPSWFRLPFAHNNNNNNNNEYCAVHVRFGDSYYRNMTKLNAPVDQRDTCRNPANLMGCMQEVLDTILTTSCPDSNSPLYVATDLADFTKFLCSSQQQQQLPRTRLLSPCDNAAIHARSRHSVDQQLLLKPSPKGGGSKQERFNPEALPVFYALLMDWLALALAPRSHAIVPSTFSYTAHLEYSI